MLDAGELELLRQWCEHHAMRWYCALADEFRGALVLECGSTDQPGLRMLLVRRDREFLLRDARSATLAAASDLRALFDALDAGLADATVAA